MSPEEINQALRYLLAGRSPTEQEQAVRNLYAQHGKDLDQEKARIQAQLQARGLDPWQVLSQAGIQL